MPALASWQQESYLTPDRYEAARSCSGLADCRTAALGWITVSHSLPTSTTVMRPACGSIHPPLPMPSSNGGEPCVGVRLRIESAGRDGDTFSLRARPDHSSVYSAVGSARCYCCFLFQLHVCLGFLSCTAGSGEFAEPVGRAFSVVQLHTCGRHTVRGYSSISDRLFCTGEHLYGLISKRFTRGLFFGGAGVKGLGTRDTSPALHSHTVTLPAFSPVAGTPAP